MLSHLPILQVIVPLLAAPLCLFMLQHPKVTWLFATLASSMALLISLLLLQQVNAQGPISYMLGGWKAPIGIEYRIDTLAAFMLILVSTMSTITLVAAQTTIENKLDQPHQTFFYIAFLLCLAGLLGIIATGDTFNLFVFLEVSSLATYTLISFGQDRRALWASFQYLIMGTIGATFILIGIGLMYMMTGTLNMQDMALRLQEVHQTYAVFTAVAFFTVGVCIKLALFPLHLWLPGAYTHAPGIVTAFLAATATKVAIYILIRFVFSIYGVEFAMEQVPLSEIFMLLGLAGIVAASVVAIYQTNLKRLFAYSSVAQMGYIILGLSLGTPAGLKAALLHMFQHALMKGAIFMALAGLVYRLGSAHLSDLRGMGHRMPITTAALVIGSLGLIGIPLTGGFISKWFLLVALIENGWWPAAAVVLFSSILAIIYVWKVIETAYFLAPGVVSNQQEGVQEAPWTVLLPTLLLALASLYFGLLTRFPVETAQQAVMGLFGGTP